MWLEWEKGLINLNYVKRIYMDEGIHLMSDTKVYRLRIIMKNNEGEYGKTYANEEEAYNAYENIKRALMPMPKVWCGATPRC